MKTLQVVVVLFVVCLTGGERATARDSVSMAEADEVLSKAIDNLFPEVDMRATFTNYRNGRKGPSKTMRIQTRWKEGYPQTRVNFVAPERMRNDAMLILGVSEPVDSEGFEDSLYWIYAKGDFDNKPRRLGGHQKSDAFYATGFTNQDIEIHPKWHYTITSAHVEQLDGEDVVVISTKPRYPNGYDRVDHYIAKSDSATLKVVGYEKGRIVRNILMKREWLTEIEGHILPLRVEAHPVNSRLMTVVIYEKRTIRPVFKDILFSLSSLTRRYSDY